MKPQTVGKQKYKQREREKDKKKPEETKKEVSDLIAYAQEDHAHPCRAGRRRLGQPPLLFTQQQTEVLKVKSLRLQLSLSVIFQRPRTGVCQHVRDLHKHVARNRRCEGSQVQKDDCHVMYLVFFSLLTLMFGMKFLQAILLAVRIRNMNP